MVQRALKDFKCNVQSKYGVVIIDVFVKVGVVNGAPIHVRDLCVTP